MNSHQILFWTIVSLVISSSFEPRMQPETSIPQGTAIIADGRISDGEWSDALALDLSGGGTLMLKHDGGSIFVGLKGTGPGWAHVYTFSEGSIRVFHASAALGTAEYKPDQNGSWTAFREFSWALRDTGSVERQQLARAVFFQREHWTANTNLVGDGSVLEFALDLNQFPSGTSFAVIFAEEGGGFSHWPDTLVDATLEKDLVFGNTPPSLSFDPSTWATLRLK